MGEKALGPYANICRPPASATKVSGQGQCRGTHLLVPSKPEPAPDKVTKILGLELTYAPFIAQNTFFCFNTVSKWLVISLSREASQMS